MKAEIRVINTANYDEEKMVKEKERVGKTSQINRVNSFKKRR